MVSMEFPRLTVRSVDGEFFQVVAGNRKERHSYNEQKPRKAFAGDYSSLAGKWKQGDTRGTREGDRCMKEWRHWGRGVVWSLRRRGVFHEGPDLCQLTDCEVSLTLPSKTGKHTNQICNKNIFPEGIDKWMNIRQNDSYKAYMFAMQHANRSFPAAGWEAAGTISWGRLKRCKEPAWVSPGI